MMSIEEEKKELVELLLKTSNPKIIKSIKRIFKQESSIDLWDELTPNQQQEITRSSSEIEKGETKDYENFMSKHR